VQPAEGSAGQPGELRLTCTLRAHLSDIPPALEALEGLLLSAGAGDEELGEVRLMAEEALMNIVSYAFDSSACEGDTPCPIRLQCVCTTDQLRLEFRDSGKPFNPLEAPPPDLSAPLEERAEGGLGIHLIRTLADAVTYEHRQGCNLLQLTRLRPSLKP
jgi:anti-sigma regulatory factor (Ser/Thr protein kinase)